MGRQIRGGAKPQVQEAKGAISAQARELFLSELAGTCNISLACRTAGIASASVYRERQRDAGFRAGWAQALREGYARLELMMLERAMNGVVKEIHRAGGVVERVTEYSDRVALQLLRMHKDLAEEEVAEADDEDVEEARQRVLARLEKLKARLG